MVYQVKLDWLVDDHRKTGSSTNPEVEATIRVNEHNLRPDGRRTDH